jgi:hypothetical protein
LWLAEAQTRGDLEQSRELLDLAGQLRDQLGGRQAKDCQLLIQHDQESINLLEQAAQAALPSPDRDAITVLAHCRVLGGHGLAPQPGEQCEVVFKPDWLELRQWGKQPSEVPYIEIVAQEWSSGPSGAPTADRPRRAR